MNTFLEELTGGIPDWTQFERVVIRLVAAMVVGAVVGFQRERAGKSAGLRTHMLVAMGSALFVLEGERAMMSMSDLSRVIQGLATGIGFIGAGAILKESAERKIEGLTTASGIWMTAAAGAAAGLGRVGLALLSVVLAWVILAFVGAIEPHIAKAKPRA
ncbi:MAG TPA: MgtC/SapB family protein [Chthoniobacterales bacterium]|jgi:putative Mg2+ transporter-C (MgtC) family protein